MPTVCSHGWRSVLHGRDLLKANLGKAIGNGKTTKLWKDSWISLNDHTKPIGPVPEAAMDLRVSDILTTDLKWNKKGLTSSYRSMRSRFRGFSQVQRELRTPSFGNLLQQEFTPRAQVITLQLFRMKKESLPRIIYKTFTG